MDSSYTLLTPRNPRKRTFQQFLEPFSPSDLRIPGAWPRDSVAPIDQEVEADWFRLRTYQQYRAVDGFVKSSLWLLKGVKRAKICVDTHIKPVSRIRHIFGSSDYLRWRSPTALLHHCRRLGRLKYRRSTPINSLSQPLQPIPPFDHDVTMTSVDDGEISVADSNLSKEIELDDNEYAEAIKDFTPSEIEALEQLQTQKQLRYQKRHGQIQQEEPVFNVQEIPLAHKERYKAAEEKDRGLSFKPARELLSELEYISQIGRFPLRQRKNTPPAVDVGQPRVEEQEKSNQTIAQLQSPISMTSDDDSSQQSDVEYDEDQHSDVTDEASQLGSADNVVQVEKYFADLKVGSRRSLERHEARECREQIRREHELAVAAAAEEAEAKQRSRREVEEEKERRRLGGRRMPAGTVVEPLNSEWEAKLGAVMRQPLSREVATSCGGTPITRAAFGTVLPQPGVHEDQIGWLNDDIINGYLEAVAQHAKDQIGLRHGQTPNVHAFSSFFYEKLQKDGPEGVRRWSSRAKVGGENLLKAEKLFIPINKGHNHWVLMYVNPQSKTVEYFDSFHQPYPDAMSKIKDWLRFELKNQFVESEWTFTQGSGPRQRNGQDCGVFCTITAKMIMLGVDPMAVTQADMPVQRRRMLAELMNGGFKGDFTPHITFSADS